MDWPSAEKKQPLALSEPWSGTASNWSSVRRYTWRVPARTPTNAIRVPSGETATVWLDVNISTPDGSVSPIA